MAATVVASIVFDVATVIATGLATKVVVVATVVVVVVCMAFVFRTMLVIQVCRVRACGGDLLVVRDRSSTGVLRIVVVAVARVHGRGSDLGGGVAVE